jgi:hypothetical protein
MAVQKTDADLRRRDLADARCRERTTEDPYYRKAIAAIHEALGRTGTASPW